MSQPSHQAPEDVKNAAKEMPPSHPDAVGAEPSGPPGGDAAGPGETKVKSGTPENAAGQINPSSPEDSNVTPGSSVVK